MKVGVVSDIHGDLVGLRKALDGLDTLGADAVICAGDLLERGDEGNEVVALIRERGIPCVKGNHEYIAIHKQEQMEARGSAKGLRHFALTAETMQFIHDLPDSLRLEFEGVGLLMAHGTPWSDFLYLYPQTREAVYQRVADEARAADARLVVLGHTHMPLIADVDDIRIINPGSVYVAGSHSYGLLSLPDRNFMVYGVDDGQPLNEVATVTYS